MSKSKLGSATAKFIEPKIVNKERQFIFEIHTKGQTVRIN